MAVLAQPPTFRIESKLVEVPVVVRDRKTGKPIKDLTAQDFVLLEDGKPQRIEFFAGNQSSLSPLATGASATNGIGQIPIYSNRSPATGDGDPIVVILIDGLNARFEDQYYAAKAARVFIEKSDQRARWAIYYLGQTGLRVVHDYSTDTSSLARLLKDIRPGGNAPDTLGAGVDFSILSSQPELARKSSGVAMEAQQYRQLLTTLTALGDIGRHLHSLPGRKTLVWMTAGFSHNTMLRLLPLLWHRTLDTLNDSNTAVYSVDSNGVRTSGGYLAENSNPRFMMQRGLGSQQAFTHVLSSIAESTGGLAFLNSNNLEKGIRQALDDSRFHYRLAYRTAHAKLDGRQVGLKVKLRGRRGLDVSHRQSFTARSPVIPGKLERERLLADGIVSPLEAVEIGITAQVIAIPDSPQSLVRLTLDSGSVTFSEEHSGFEGRFDVRCVQSTATAKVLDDFTEEAKLELDGEKARRATTEGFNYEMRVEIHPEAKFMKLAFCDVRSGRLGTLRIELP